MYPHHFTIYSFEHFIVFLCVRSVESIKTTVTPSLKHHQTAVLSVMYLTAVGFVMVSDGIGIDISNDYHTDVPVDAKLSFAGGFLTTLFWVCYNK